MNEQIGILTEWLAGPKRIAITTHQKPDGDAIGSSLALYHYLNDKGHKVKVVVPTDYTENLKWLPGTDEVMIGPNDPEGAKWVFEGADLIFCLDFNGLSRINEFGDTVGDSEAKKILVDHHLEPQKFEDLAFWDSEASSTAEIVYRIIVGLGDKENISLQVAESLYTGVLTDTGSFRFSTTSPEVHLICAHLLSIGVDKTRIYDNIYNNSSENRLRFLGYCFTNCLFVHPQYRTAYIKVGKEVFKEFYIKPGDTEGLVNFALGLKGIDLAVLMTAQDDIIKLSFRSRGDVSSNELAKHFDGGGHFYASGGRSTASMEDTEKKLLELVSSKFTEEVIKEVKSA